MKQKNVFNNHIIEITRYGLITDKVNDGVVIAHLSDLHEKEFGAGNLRLFEEVAALQPDMIAVTGDVVAHENQKNVNLGYMKCLAKGLSQIAPAFFVTGNHERQYDEEICGTLERYGMTVVKDTVHSLVVRGSVINISGMDDVSFDDTDVLRSLEVFAELKGYNIFLTHRPEFYELYLNKNIDLILAGHTHAGQIRIPKVCGFYMYGQGWFPKYMQGEFTDGSTTMIISRGLGSSGYPAVRINNPPDLVAVYLEKNDDNTQPGMVY